jgi:RNA polymerase sigma factor (sigma-70 family)
LERFVLEQDESAFAEILQRHGRMVLGVCLRTLRDWHEAEDAFQATFLILARRAHSGRWQPSIGNWLYTVAGRVARKAKARTARCQAQQEQVEGLPAREPAEARADDVQRLLLDELNHLPDRYRLPLVLCYLEGKTNQQAADDLGWSLGAVWSNLSRGRSLLRARLQRHGPLLSAALCALLLGRDATAAATAALVERTSRAAVLFAFGQTINQALASSAALALANGVSITMTVKQYTIVGCLVLLLGIAGFQASAAWLGGSEPVLERMGSRMSQQVAERGKPAEKPRPPEPPPARKGATAEEAALKAGLDWLVRQQQPDGHWTLPESQWKNDTAATAMGLLPLLRAGAARKGTPAEKQYGKAVQKGLEFLLRKQQPDGSYDPLMYAQGMATMAVCEAYAQTSSEEHKKSAQKAMDYLSKAQSSDGCWNYRIPSQGGDSSISIWQAEALWLGSRAGLEVPQKVWQRYAGFLDSVATGDGRYGYTSTSTGSAAITASCLVGRRLTGWDPSRAEFVKGVEVIRVNHVTNMREGCYYYYHAALLMNSLGADTVCWNRELRATLLSLQQPDGGWDETSDHWGKLGGGRLMVTSLSLLSLQVKPTWVPLAEVPKGMTDEQLRQLWNDLAREELPRVALAMRTLAAVPDQAVPLLRRQLRPVPVRKDSERIERLIRDLDSDTFEVRQKAEGELAEVGEPVRRLLEKALQRPGKLEFRRRVERLLERLDEKNLHPERCRELRGIRVLEHVNTPEARKVLKSLAEGAEGATLTEEARAALARMAAGKKDKR